jgi:hypothetical protein
MGKQFGQNNNRGGSGNRGGGGFRVVQEEIGVEEEDLVWIKVHLLSLCLMEHMFIVLKILLLLNVQIAQEFLSLIEEFIYNQKQK